MMERSFKGEERIRQFEDKMRKIDHIRDEKLDMNRRRLEAKETEIQKTIVSTLSAFLARSPKNFLCDSGSKQSKRRKATAGTARARTPAGREKAEARYDRCAVARGEEAAGGGARPLAAVYQ